MQGYFKDNYPEYLFRGTGIKMENNKYYRLCRYCYLNGLTFHLVVKDDGIYRKYVLQREDSELLCYHYRGDH